MTTGGVGISEINSTEIGAYKDLSGGRAQRLITPCEDEQCAWFDDLYGMPINRWYPSLETLEDGVRSSQTASEFTLMSNEQSSVIIGGERDGGFVNAPGGNQNEPS